MLNSFLKKSLLGIMFAKSAVAEIPFTETRDVYEATHPEQRPNSPLWGMVALNSYVIEGLRFNGNYGVLAEAPGQNYFQRTLLHPAFDSKPASELIWPYDPAAAVLQHLFPSMDGAILTANQRDKDPIAALGKDLSRMNLLLTEILHIQTTIRDWFAGNPHLTMLEKYQHWTRQTQQRIFNILIKQSKNAPLSLELIDRVKGEYLEEGQTKKLTYRQLVAARFASALTRALYNERTNSGINFIYPPNFCMKALLAFVWKTASHKNDLKALTCLLDPNKLTDSYFGNADYNSIVTYMGARVPPTPLHPEWVTLLFKGFSVYDDPIPEPISYETTYFLHTNAAGKTTQYSYPDCGETSLRNLFYIFLSDRGIIDQAFIEELFARIEIPGNQDMDRKDLMEKFPALKMLIGYLNKFSSLEYGVTDKAHAEWSELICDLNSKNTALVKDKTLAVKYKNLDLYELAGRDGLQNMLNVFAHLIPDAVLNTPWEKETGNYKQAAEKLDRLCKLFSREDFELSWKVDGCRSLPRNENIIIQFHVNEAPRADFQWHLKPTHFDVPKLFYEKSQALSNITWNDPKLAKNYLFNAWLLRMRPDLNCDASLPAGCIFSLSFKHLDQSIKAFKYFLLKRDPKYHHIIYKIISNIARLQDKHAYREVGPLVYQYLQINPQLKLENYAYLSLPCALQKGDERVVELGFASLKAQSFLNPEFLKETAFKVIKAKNQEMAEYLLSRFPEVIKTPFYSSLSNYVQGSNADYLSITDFLLKLLKPEASHLEKVLIPACLGATNPVKVFNVLLRNGLSLTPQNQDLLLSTITKKGVIQFINCLLEQGIQLTPEKSGIVIAAAIQSLDISVDDQFIPPSADYTESFDTGEFYSPASVLEIIEFLLSKGATFTSKNTFQILESFLTLNLYNDEKERNEVKDYLLAKIPATSAPLVIDLIKTVISNHCSDNSGLLEHLLTLHAQEIEAKDYQQLFRDALTLYTCDIAELLLRHAAHLDPETLRSLYQELENKKATANQVLALFSYPMDYLIPLQEAEAMATGTAEDQADHEFEE
ncbi:hypothetical protein [Candidatus Odyssella thessalonicensis]|uniref:hypothetical protein n=1 Tax=Candidatus Odyssella thessalonicensis TaxID=84647 RepID=UPI000225A9B7|nr:hypothetical protein [Candidatus Odyssella thessalonicensis]